MAGRIRRQLSAQRWALLTAREALQVGPRSPEGWPLCGLCGRPAPPPQQDAHHLVPKSHGGRQTVTLHRICHRQIHALFSEVELARTYSSLAALQADARVAAFIAWVSNKPPAFDERVRKPRRRR